MNAIRLSFRVVIEAFYRFNRDDGWAIASHIALSALMSMFPFFLVLTAITGIIGSDNLADEAARIVLEAWPEEVSAPIAQEIHNVLTGAHGRVLTVGALLALYFASSGIGKPGMVTSEPKGGTPTTMTLPPRLIAMNACVMTAGTPITSKA